MPWLILTNRAAWFSSFHAAQNWMVMSISRGARALLSFLQQKSNPEGVSWWSQDRMAKELGYRSDRTIRRLVRELVAEGSLVVTRRGSTSGAYLIGQNVRSDRTKCPLASIEQNLKPVKTSSTPMPAEFTENEYGRREPNPDWLTVQAALRRARTQIAAARNPIAYENAVIREALERKPMRREVAS